MTELELTDAELLYASPEDWAFYNKCIEGLPDISNNEGGVKLSKTGEPIPYGSGPHILKWFKEAIAIVKPCAILEVGFNIGYGSAMLLNLCDAFVLSIDITKRPETIDAYGHLYNKFKGRFDFGYRWLEGTNGKLKDRRFDLCFLDGGHDEEDVTNDIQLCKELKIPYLLLDDIYSRFGPGVVPAIAKFPELELVKDMNNLRLYKINY